MNNENQFEELEKELFEYFERKRKLKIPLSTQNVIKNAFKEKEIKARQRKNIPQTVMYIFSIFILMTGIVFAKDVIEIISSLFINSTDSIDTAVENGYVQNVDMDFVYNNDIGIKVNYVLIDNSSLDISYVYKCDNQKYLVNNIELYEYEIKDDMDNILYQFNSENSINTTPLIVKTMTKPNNTIQLQENMFNELILYFADNFPDIEKLFINVKSVKINDSKMIDGNWELELTLEDKFTQRENIIYEIEKNEQIKSCEITLSETTLKIFLEIYEKCDNIVILQNKPQLQNEFGQSYNCKTWNNRNLENGSEYFLEFDVSQYDKNIEILYLKLKIAENQTIDIQLNQK